MPCSLWLQHAVEAVFISSILLREGSTRHPLLIVTSNYRKSLRNDLGERSSRNEPSSEHLWM